MKYVLVALMLIATPVFALQVVTKDDVLVRQDDGTVIAMTKAELAVALSEAEARLHNASVSASNEQATLTNQIEGIKAVINNDVVNAELTPDVDTVIY